MSRLTIRLNDYQRDVLQRKAKEAEFCESELVRILIDKFIEGKIQIKNSSVFEGADITGLRRIANKKGVSVQCLIDAIVEQLDEPKGSKR
ncbi:hypothetical protein [Butyrivibrio sp. AE2032]|uniref:hypothetical protein n=1 Tax=Butyrivibrio sp. AE2032 TaxID=1458463 RepID=UPI0005509881|nr:hypothetical protein [Butyrivibrio sp. AE2032]